MNKWARKFVAGILAAAMILSVYTPGYVKGAEEENQGTVKTTGGRRGAG